VIKGPDEPIQAAMSGKPTLEYRLLPVFAHPNGFYKNQSYYLSLDIGGADHNIVKTAGGPGRVFLNLFLANWDPEYAGDPFAPGVTRLRHMISVIDADSFDNGLGAPLQPAYQPCANQQDCAAAFGEIAGMAYVQGVCEYHWVTRPPQATRSDGIYNELPSSPPWCSVWIWDSYVSGGDPAFTMSSDANFCGRPDDKPQHYAGTLAVDVPGLARGTFTIGFLVAAASDDSQPDAIPIPFLRVVPAVIETAPCCNRFISIATDPAGGGSAAKAIRVTLTSLYHPNPLPTEAPSPDFSDMEGKVRWVNAVRDAQGNPMYECQDSATLGTSYPCVKLGCTPEYRDWGALLEADEAFLFGDAIIPDSVYTVDFLPQSCQGNESNCPAAFGAFTAPTPRWGNINAHDTVNIIDPYVIVDKVRGLSFAAQEPRTMLRPAVLQPQTTSVSAPDIAAAVDALKGYPYPFDIGSCPGD
jgi:hypothetical protein